MTVPKLKAEIRNMAEGKTLTMVRETGYIPGVLYGAGKETKEIVLQKKELNKILSKYGSTGTITVELENETVLALIKEIQRDVIKDFVLHVDLQELSADKKVRLRIPIAIQGRESVEARTSAVVEQQLMEIELQCLPKYISQHISVDVSTLNFGEVIKISDLDISKDENFEIFTDSEEVIVSLTASSKREETEEDTEVPIYNSEKSILDK